MPCFVDISQSDITEHFKNLLCQACKFLTRDQINSLRNPNSGIMDGIDWYAEHLHTDIVCNKELNMNEVEIAKKELMKLGLEIKYDTVGSELIKCQPKKYPY